MMNIEVTENEIGVVEPNLEFNVDVFSENALDKIFNDLMEMGKDEETSATK